MMRLGELLPLTFFSVWRINGLWINNYDSTGSLVWRCISNWNPLLFELEVLVNDSISCPIWDRQFHHRLQGWSKLEYSICCEVWRPLHFWPRGHHHCCYCSMIDFKSTSAAIAITISYWANWRGHLTSTDVRCPQDFAVFYSCTVILMMQDYAISGYSWHYAWTPEVKYTHSWDSCNYTPQPLPLPRLIFMEHQA